MFSGAMDVGSAASASSSGQAAAIVPTGPATPLGASSMSEFTLCAKRSPVQGCIDGKRHVAAFTGGDGACGLHSVFGVPSEDGGTLQLARARDAILSQMPESFEVLCGKHNGALREFCQKVMEGIWTDMALPAARAAVDNALASCTFEVRFLWGGLEQFLQAELISFVQQQRCELKQSNVLTNQLLSCAKQLFRPAREASVVRPLCVLLGYLHPTDFDFLNTSPSSAEVLTHEGDKGDLALLHPCAENGLVTKYQALFDPSEMYGKYRLAFFMNGAHNAHAGRTDWMLDALDTIEQCFATSAEAEILRNARATVEGRYMCFGDKCYPSGCTLQRAWSTFRSAFKHSDYWLSVE